MPLANSHALDAVKRVCARLEATARQPGRSYQNVLALPELPFTALANVCALTRLDDPRNADALPSLLAEAEDGQAQLELCPFGPLALITSDGDMNTDPLAQTLTEAGITPLFPSDLDAAGDWHGAVLVRWLFPSRLADALALFDTLRA